jgi:hypothetical protein
MLRAVIRITRSGTIALPDGLAAHPLPPGQLAGVRRARIIDFTPNWLLAKDAQ